MSGQIEAPTSITITGLIQTALNFLPPIILLVFLGIIVYGGFVRMTASGDADKEQQSSQIITAGVVGFIIIALAPIIINFLGQLLGISNLIK